MKSVNETEAELIIKETYRDPSQTKLSFPAVGGEGVRPYIKESLLRLSEDEEEELEEEAEGEEWEAETETESREGTVTFSALQSTHDHDAEAEEEE